MNLNISEALNIYSFLKKLYYCYFLLTVAAYAISKYLRWRCQEKQTLYLAAFFSQSLGWAPLGADGIFEKEGVRTSSGAIVRGFPPFRSARTIGPSRGLATVLWAPPGHGGPGQAPPGLGGPGQEGGAAT